MNPCVSNNNMRTSDLAYTDVQYIIVTSSVTYCAPPETLLIEQFDLAYFAKNSSISFNISAASVVSDYLLLSIMVFDIIR